MAELLNKIPTNLTEYPNSFKRQGAFPLEAYSVFYSKADADAYAATNAVSYVGQTLAVVKANAEDPTKVDDVTLYIIANAAGALQEVGKATSGDGNTITLADNGTLSLAGFDAALDFTLPQKQDDGTIKWVPIDAIVEGDGNTKTLIKIDDEEGHIILTTSRDERTDTTTYSFALDLGDYSGRLDAIEDTLGDNTKGLVKAVADNAQAISNIDAAYKTADTNTLNSAKAYTDEELAGIEVAIEKRESVEYIVLKNKDGDEIASVDASKFVQDSLLDDVAYDSTTGKITFTWLMGDGSSKTDEIDIAHLVDTYTAGTGLKVENNEFSVDTSVIATVESLEGVRELADAAQTADEVAAAIEARITEENLSQYAKVVDVVANDTFEDFKTANTDALTAKLDTETYEAEKATFATKAEVEAKADSSALSDYYTKTEIDGKGYAVAETVASIYATKDDLAPVRAAASNAETSVNNLTERFDEIVAVGGEPNAINNIKVNGNTLSISDKTVDISVPTQITDLTDSQTVLDDIAAAKANAAQGISDAAAVAADLSSLTFTVTGLGGTINELTADLANKANVSDVYTKDETIAAITSSVNAKAEEIDATVATINAKIADVYTKTEANNLFLNQDQVDARISTLIDAANNEDTITNVNDLVNYVNKNAIDLAALITNVNKNSAAIADIIQPKASEEISVAEDGTLGINKISTDKLVQGDKTLVLSGGTATV